MADTTKEARIELRLNKSDKSLLENAAGLLGLSLASYLLSKALPAARRDVDEVNTLKLSNADRDHFLKLLENPPKPNARLKKAFRLYKEAYGA